MGLSGEEFLTRMAVSSFRVGGGFSSSQIMNAERGENSIVLTYNSDIFMVVNETLPPREVKNIYVACMFQESHPGEHPNKGVAYSCSEIFVYICKQVMSALHTSLDEAGLQKMITELGMDGELLDGVQRRVRFGDCKYIVKYNENGMLIMVASSL